jgi:hypothetical protein
LFSCHCIKHLFTLGKKLHCTESQLDAGKTAAVEVSADKANSRRQTVRRNAFIKIVKAVAHQVRRCALLRCTPTLVN